MLPLSPIEIHRLSSIEESRITTNSNCPQIAPLIIAKMKQMCAASADENGFVISYDEAYNLIKETYSGSMQVTEDCKITDWQGAKKAYHGQKGFGLDIDKYENISKEDLINLQNTKGGLIPYVQKGGRLPPIKFIKDFQQKIHDFYHLENTEVIRDAKHYGMNTGETPCIE